MLKSKSQLQAYSPGRLISVAASASIVGNVGRWEAVAKAVEVGNIPFTCAPPCVVFIGEQILVELTTHGVSCVNTTQVGETVEEREHVRGWWCQCE